MLQHQPVVAGQLLNIYNASANAPLLHPKPLESRTAESRGASKLWSPAAAVTAACLSSLATPRPTAHSLRHTPCDCFGAAARLTACQLQHLSLHSAMLDSPRAKSAAKCSRPCWPLLLLLFARLPAAAAPFLCRCNSQPSCRLRSLSSCRCCNPAGCCSCCEQFPNGLPCCCCVLQPARLLTASRRHRQL
jgi:hypothetical protein